MKRFAVLAAMAALGAMASPALAETRQFKAKDAIAIEPAKAYVLIRSDLGIDLQLLKMVDEAQQVKWRADRAAALAKAKVKYGRTLKNYERDIEDWQDPGMRAVMRVKPVKPTSVEDETFFFPPALLGNFSTVFAGRVFAKLPDSRAYFLAVEPGTYILYGAILTLQNGVTGTCFCMGSVRFEAEAGKIVDAGEIRIGKDTPFGQFAYVPPSSGAAGPPQLANLPVMPAKLGAAGKMPNYFGVNVNRIGKVANVLEYDRDIPIDVASGGKLVEAIR